MDILKLGPDGRMSRGREKASTYFYSYDEPISSPTDGRIVKVVDNVEGGLIGNYIIIAIENEKYVFLAHIKNGSIVVVENQFVKAGTFVGRVGNSGGASGILHLHMHVQNKPTWDRGRKVTYPIRFRKMLRKRFLLRKEVSNGYLLRNDMFSD
jgi:murein DD-endopeptidase MepM/ murein hydrolase activator NlpD